MAANITSGTRQSYEAPGIRILQGLAPDLVLLQELRYGGIPNGGRESLSDLASGAWVDASVPDRAFA